MLALVIPHALLDTRPATSVSVKLHDMSIDDVKIVLMSFCRISDGKIHGLRADNFE